jgi:hypothetical protein
MARRLTRQRAGGVAGARHPAGRDAFGPAQGVAAGDAQVADA